MFACSEQTMKTSPFGEEGRKKAKKDGDVDLLSFSGYNFVFVASDFLFQWLKCVARDKI